MRQVSDVVVGTCVDEGSPGATVGKGQMTTGATSPIPASRYYPAYQSERQADPKAAARANCRSGSPRPGQASCGGDLGGGKFGVLNEVNSVRRRGHLAKGIDEALPQPNI